MQTRASIPLDYQPPNEQVRLFGWSWRIRFRSWLLLALTAAAGYWVWLVRAPWYLVRTIDAVSAISPDGRRVLGSEGVIDAESGKLILRIPAWEAAQPTPDPAYKPPAKFSPDGRYIEFEALSLERQCWDIDAQRDITAEARSRGIIEGPFSAAAPESDSVRLWDNTSGKAVAWLHRPGAPPGPVSDDDVYGDIRFAFSRDRQLLATSFGRWLCVWESATGKLRRKIDVPEPRFIREVALSSDGRQVATYDQGVVQLWDGQSGALLATANIRPPDGYSSIDFSADDRRIIVGIQAALEAPSLRLVGQAPNHGVWADDGRHLLCRNKGVYVVWDVDRNLAEAELTQPPGDEHGQGAFTAGGWALLERCRWKKDQTAFNVGERPTPATYWKRRRPDAWWGYAYLPQVWVATALLLATLVLFLRDMRARR